jgi:sugar phosphate isomerase/epimerase
MIPADVVDLLEQTGRHCIVGEFGDVQPSPVGSGQCDVKAVVEAAKGVGYKAVYGWAWNGDGGSLNMVSPSWSSNPVAAEYTVTDYSVSLLELL